MSSYPATTPIAGLAARIKAGDLSSSSLVDHFLARIEALDPGLNAFNTVTAEQARERAAVADREIEAGQYRGPLHGIPVGLKDLLQTAGVRTTASSRILADWVPAKSATVVERLEAAGAISLGKLNMTEFALSGYHPDLEAPVNPWSADHWPGVSSSGSGVAVAARLCCAAIGTDTGGSIRLPSAANGVVGIKPTYGRVSRFNGFPLAESLDHFGPMAGSVEDAALVLNAIAGYDVEDPTSLDVVTPDFTAGINREIRGLRIGIDERYNAQVDPQVLDRAFGAMDLLLCPSLAGPAPSLEEFPPQMSLPAEAVGPIVLYQAPFNFSGSPTISVPMGFSEEGLPLSLQLVGRHCEEALLIRAAHAYEQATEWHRFSAPGAQL